MPTHEEAIIQSFIVKPRRTRWLESLALPDRRAKMLDRLNHCRDLDERFLTLLPSNTDVVALLRTHDAPASCYVLSNAEEIDGRTMGLEIAISEAEAAGWGTIIGCLPGRLAYFYDECGERRMLLKRDM